MVISHAEKQGFVSGVTRRNGSEREGDDVDAEEALELAQELDGMERDVTSWEADFLASVLPLLREGRGLSEKQEAVLLKMKKTYLDVDDEVDTPMGGDVVGDSEE